MTTTDTHGDQIVADIEQYQHHVAEAVRFGRKAQTGMRELAETTGESRWNPRGLLATHWDDEGGQLFETHKARTGTPGARGRSPAATYRAMLAAGRR